MDKINSPSSKCQKCERKDYAKYVQKVQIQNRKLNISKGTSGVKTSGTYCSVC